MSEKKRYFRLNRAERAAIERGLDSRRSARVIARDLGRSTATITKEVYRNRFVCKGPGKGELVEALPEGVCPKLLAWPHVCNGCRYRRYHCSNKFRCEYSAARAQLHADEVLSHARQGVDCTEERFGIMMGCIRDDIARGLSPAQIAHGRAAQFKVSTSSIYRWIAKGYGGMAQIDLRRQVGYKPRKHSSEIKPTSHGKERSYTAFLSLGEERCAQAVEMDCVMEKSSDSKCILTLYVRPCKFQFAILLPEKTSSAVACALDMLEDVFGKEYFQQIFGLILTDNGTEFADSAALERSCKGKTRRCRVYYCDVRQSQQKGGCERNHVELRKIIPKGRGISFDGLTAWDMGTLMSHLNSEPRPSLANMTPLAMLKAAFGPSVNNALDALGVCEVGYADLRMSVEAINLERKRRGSNVIVVS